MVKRLAYKKEPKIHIHRYVVLIERETKTGSTCGYRYAMNMKEVNQIKKALAPGRKMLVFKASHEYIKGWEK